MVRVGLLSVILLLERQQESQQPVDMGCMITASHNDESYNGVKLSNPDGSMLTPPQEQFLTEYVNEREVDKWISMIDTKIEGLNDKLSTQVKLHVGCDTRSHSTHLSSLYQLGSTTLIEQYSINIQVVDHGVVTTPMLHHIVLHSNPTYLPPYIQPKPTRAGYIETFTQPYVELCKTTSGTNKLIVDGACGVGHQAVEELAQTIQDKSGGTTSLFLIHNGPGDGPLNENCGSEHVQKSLQPPAWYDGIPSNTEYCCSLDGDADRIVFFSSQDGDLTYLLDGDKIAILIAHVLKTKLGASDQIKMGIVQTAYANGASTDYVTVRIFF
jgi:phosphoacetylglucosamine mutase